MKNVTKFIIFSLAVCFTFLLVSGEAEAATFKNSLTMVQKPTIKKVSDDEWTSMYKGATAKSAKSAAKKIRKYMLKRKKTFTVTLSWSNLNTADVLRAIGEIDNKKTSDDADFLMGSVLYIGYSGYYNRKNKMVTKWKVGYTENASQVKKINKASKKILKELNVSGMSDVAKVKTIHDYVVGLVTYDESLSDYSAYGGLVAKKHSTVCQGYALIMYKLLTDAKVPCHYVTGDVGGAHAWNIVKINKKWYHLDTTWDDPSYYPIYDYFLKGSKTFSNDHTTDKYYKNKYKIASDDLDWETMLEESTDPDDKNVPIDQTEDEIESGKKALERKAVIRELHDAIDEAVKSDNPDPNMYEEVLIDSCKMIYNFIIQRMSDKAFNALTDNEKMMEALLDETFDLIDKYLIDPITEFVDSDDFDNYLFERLCKDFGKDEIKKLPEDSLKSLISLYMCEVINNKFHEQMDKYGDFIIQTMVDKLDDMV